MDLKPFELLERVNTAHGRVRYNLSTSDMPPTKLSEVMRLPDLSLSENVAGGGRSLRSLLARRFGGRADDYIVTCGASEANFAVAAGLVRRGDGVLVEVPTYQPLLSISEGLGARVTRVRRREDRGFRLALDDVRASARNKLRLLVFSNLNNPTGVAASERDLRGIVELARERGFYVLVDEMFRELAFDEPSPTVGGLDDHAIITSGVSKFYGAGGLRIGWIRAAEEPRRAIRRVLDYMSIAPSGISERIAVALLQKKGRIAARNRRLIQEGRKIAREWAASTRGVGWYESAGNLVFPRLPVETKPLADRLLRKHRTFLAPGEAFGMPRHFRLNVGLGAANVAGGLREVTKAMRSL